MNSHSALDAAARSVLPGETVLWSARAPSGLRVHGRDALLIPFSLLWFGFAVFWETSVFQAHAPVFFRLWGIPFVLAGLYLVAGRFFADAYLRSRTSYAVSDRAAYIVRTGPFASERRYGTAALDSLTFEPRAEGTGTIRFVANSRRGSRNPWNPSSLDAFESIPDARRVYEMIVAARNRH